MRDGRTSGGVSVKPYGHAPAHQDTPSRLRYALEVAHNKSLGKHQHITPMPIEKINGKIHQDTPTPIPDTYGNW